MKKPKGTHNILVIDDDPSILKLVEAILAPVGYQLQLAQSGEMAMGLAELSEEDFDLLLTDVVMPEMSGEELALFFKKSYPHTKVLFMSAYMKPSTEKFEDMHGKVDFIVKPFTPKKLCGKVKRILS